jgi:hypothetical protein
LGWSLLRASAAFKQRRAKRYLSRWKC